MIASWENTELHVKRVTWVNVIQTKNISFIIYFGLRCVLHLEMEGKHDDNIKAFSENFENWEKLLKCAEIRKTLQKITKYSSIVEELPRVFKADYGYHSECYSKFTSVKQKVLRQKWAFNMPKLVTMRFHSNRSSIWPSTMSKGIYKQMAHNGSSIWPSTMSKGIYKQMAHNGSSIWPSTMSKGIYKQMAHNGSSIWPSTMLKGIYKQMAQSKKINKRKRRSWRQNLTWEPWLLVQVYDIFRLRMAKFIYHCLCKHNPVNFHSWYTTTSNIHSQ